MTAFPLARPVLSLDNQTHQEVGDAIYNSGGWGFGHAGIYYRFVDGDPADDNNHKVIHAQQLYDAVIEDTLANFKIAEKQPYFGGHHPPGLTYAGRNEIIHTAESLRDASHISYTLFNAIDYYGADFDGTIADIDNLRCDGAVEYAYEVNAVDVWGAYGMNYDISVYPDSHNNSPVGEPNSDYEFAPHIQRGGVYTPDHSRMDPSIPTPPTIQLRDSKGVILPGGSTSDTTVEAYVTDNDYGSGLKKLEIWNGDPASGGTLLKSLPQEYNVDHTYDNSEIGPLPEGPIFFRAVDQGGNYTQVTFRADTHPPLIANFSADQKPIPQNIITVAMPYITAIVDDLISGVDLNSIMMLIDGIAVRHSVQPWDSYLVTTLPTAPLADGEHTVTLTASDLAGNKTSTTVTFTVKAASSTTPLVTIGTGSATTSWDAGKFTTHIPVTATAPVPLAELQLWSLDATALPDGRLEKLTLGTLISSVPASETGAATFITENYGQYVLAPNGISYGS